MTMIKVCGIKTIRDVEYVNELMPDYVGFVFAESERRLSIEPVLKMRNYINKDIKVVGVFVDEDIDKVREIAYMSKLDVIQLHGVEDIDYIKCIEKSIEAEIWKALCIESYNDIAKMEQYEGYRLLIDGAYAGAGKTFDWELVFNAKLCGEFILAGGLNFHNVQQGIELLKPSGVDVSSGVESGGIKDYIKMKNFIERVREYDKRKIR